MFFRICLKEVKPERLRAASCALRNAELLCADYLDTVQQYAKQGDFLYIDPPYHPISQYSDFKRYTVAFFYEDDQRALAKTMKGLAQQGCYVLVSNSYCDFIFDIYSGCQIIEVSAKRNINKTH